MPKKKADEEVIDPIPAEEPEVEAVEEEIASTDDTEPEAESEAAAEVVDEPIVKAGGRKVRVRKFFGLYKNARFVNDEADEWGVANRVSDEVLEQLRQDYPGAEIEVID